MIRVEASEAPLRDLVEEVANQAGFRLLGPTLPHIMVSIRKDCPLEELLLELLEQSSSNFILRYENQDGGRLSEVVILGGDGTEDAEDESAQDAEGD